MKLDNQSVETLTGVPGMMIRVASGIAAILLTLASARAETPLERGAYLVNTIGSCGNCHTPRDSAGKPRADVALSGGFEFDEVAGHVITPNITPDPETGIGKWSEAEIVTALRDGKRPDGSIIGPPMPIPSYKSLSDRDATAIAIYLRSLKPVRHAVARTQFKIALPASYGAPVTHVDEPSRDTVAYGEYLAGPVGHCVLCHTPRGSDRPFDMSRAYQGGREIPNFEKPGENTVSRNITADPEQGIGQWTDMQIKRAITEGVRPDGTRLVRTMGFDFYKSIAPADLDAIVAYLRSLKPTR